MERKGQEEINFGLKGSARGKHMLIGVPMLLLGAQWLKTRPHNVLYLSTHWRKIFRMGPTNIGPSIAHLRFFFST